jgi:hypothetical protein
MRDKEPSPDPSKIRAFDFKGKFGRGGICSVSETIGINRSIFVSPGREPNSDPLSKKDRRPLIPGAIIDGCYLSEWRPQRREWGLAALTPQT